jgi:NAD(P)-dependent dehydrogenase (short-subunit alcohol dehydrogenase family)
MEALDRTFAELKKQWETLDFVVHAIGFSDKNELRGKFVDTSLDNFLMTMNISVYSFVAVTQRARAMMKPGGSLLTLTYYGAEKGHPALQRDGRRQGGAGVERQISGDGPRPGRHPGQRHLRRADQDSGGERDRRLPLHHEVERI